MPEPKRRGRPPGPPKPPKEPKPLGRRSPWSGPAAIKLTTQVPEHVADAWRAFAFKQQIDRLAIEFLEGLEK